jgi:hypothetical protein
VADPGRARGRRRCPRRGDRPLAAVGGAGRREGRGGDERGQPAPQARQTAPSRVAHAAPRARPGTPAASRRSSRAEYHRPIPRPASRPLSRVPSGMAIAASASPRTTRSRRIGRSSPASAWPTYPTELPSWAHRRAPYLPSGRRPPRSDNRTERP